MARPRPFSFIARTLKGIKTEIVEGDGIFAVLFEDDPNVPIEQRFVAVNCRQSTLEHPDSIKYARMIYVHKGHALKKARELNSLYSCSLFKVVEMKPYRIVE
jgi:hypothetical protein